MNKLTDFARALAERLYAEIPSLVAHSRLLPSDCSIDHELHLWIPPARTDTEPMVVETYGDQINIYFDMWCTFRGTSDDDEDLGDDWEVIQEEPKTVDELITSVVELISGILSEEIAIVLYAGASDRWVAAGTFIVREGAPLDDDQWRVCVRSWRATYDAGWLLPWRRSW